MDVMAGLSAAGQALGALKTLRQTEKRIDEAAFRIQIADLTSAVADMKMALSDARDLLAEKDREIERLRISFQEKGELVKAKGDYLYRTDEDGHPTGYPVCPRCHETEGRNVQLKRDGRYYEARCPVCSTAFRPVTAYYPDGRNGPTTSDDAAREQRAEQTRRSHASMRRLGRTLA